MKRRKFIHTAALLPVLPLAKQMDSFPGQRNREPVIISTWKFGAKANPVAMDILATGGTALDAVEAGVKVIEADPDIRSVGLGGIPDQDGNVTCDASIMDHEGNAGAVAYLRNILHPISVARKVMEETPHVLLAGDGAFRFARKQGFPKVNLLTEKSRQIWLKGLHDDESHDTIAMLAQDSDGNLAGACTTSGLANKLPGRVGDSPIIGAGLYVDNEVGAAGATGMGEWILKYCGSFLVVEFMRRGDPPEVACRKVTARMARSFKHYSRQIASFVALRKDGLTGAATINTKIFPYVVSRGKETIVKNTS